MPEGAENWVVESGITEDGPEIRQVGVGATVRTMSELSVQPLDWMTVRRSVADGDETWAVVVSDVAESMVALPDTTLQVVEAIGCKPGVA